MKKRKKDAPVERVETPSFTDPQGSWTGVPLDPFAEPVQDADDLCEKRANDGRPSTSPARHSRATSPSQGEVSRCGGDGRTVPARGMPHL